MASIPRSTHLRNTVRLLRENPAVALLGARQTGKTTLAGDELHVRVDMDVGLTFMPARYHALMSLPNPDVRMQQHCSHPPTTLVEAPAVAACGTGDAAKV